MFSDADPAVALDPKQQHRELTKPGIYSGIPVAVSSLPKTNNTLCIALILPEKHTLTSVLRQKNPSNAIFLVTKTPISLCCCISSMVET